MKKRTCFSGILILGALVLMFAFVGCNQEPEPAAGRPAGQEQPGGTYAEPVTLRFSWWGGESRHEATIEAINAFTALHPHITIEAEYSGFAGYYQRLVTQLASGTAPDIFQSDQGWTVELHRRGDAFADMNQFSDIIRTDQFHSTMLENFSIIDDQLVVLPMGFNGTVFLYNRDLMEPFLIDGGLTLTWEQFIEIGMAMREIDPETFLTTNMTDPYVRFMLRPIIEQITNRPSVNDDFTLGFDSGELAEAFEIMLNVFDSGAAQPYAESVIFRESLMDNPKWLNGQIGGIFIFFSNIDRETGGLDFNFGVAPLPMIAGAQTSGQESGPNLMMAISNSSPHQREAAKFVDWFLNDPEAALILRTERGAPANTEALQILVDNDLLSPLMAQAIEVSNATMSFPSSALEMNASVHAVFVESMERVLFHRATPEAAAEELIGDLNRVFTVMQEE